MSFAKLPEEIFDLSFRVVVYRDGDVWTAHSLELDLVGSGETSEEALSELSEMIDCQVTFAMQAGDASLIYHEAPPEIFELWEEAECRKKKCLFAAAVPPGRLSVIRDGNEHTEEEGPIAKFLGLTGRRLDDLRRTPMDLIPCG
jgi:hypothetical protein